MLLTALTEIPPDTGGPKYVTAAVVVSAVLVLVYLLIVAIRVRDAARRLEALESRLDGAQQGAAAQGGSSDRPAGVGDPAEVAAAAEAMGAKR